MAFADQHPKIGAIGPKIFGADGKTVQASCARRLPSLYFEFLRLTGLRAKFPAWFEKEYIANREGGRSRSVEGLAGACMVVRTTAIRQVGMLDEAQFMYKDEIEWCKRLLAHGWEIYFLAETSILHYGGESAKQVKLETALHTERATLYYYRKHHGRAAGLVFLLLVNTISSGKWLVSRLTSGSGEAQRDLRQIYQAIWRWAWGELFASRNWRRFAAKT